MIEEGRLLARVRHPNVVTVYGAERIGGRVGVWMELVHGSTLETELREHGPFEVEPVIQIGVELGDALAAVHRAGLLHRDVKAFAGVTPSAVAAAPWLAVDGIAWAAPQRVSRT